MVKKNLTALLSSALFIFAISLALPCLAADRHSTSNIEIFRQKVIADKKMVVATNLSLTPVEAKAFWPIYDAYQIDLKQLNQRTIKLVDDYATAYNKGFVPDDTAKILLDEAIAIELDEAKLKQSYVPKLSQALPMTKVARYIQIETKIQAIVRYRLADGIPFIE